MNNRNTRLRKWILYYREHYVVQNMWRRLPYFGLLFLVGILISLWVHKSLKITVDHDLYLAFVRSIFSLAITTITLAIPNCMRTIFATYEGFYSSTIKDLLMKRLPMTMLILTAFATLVLTIMALCGLTGDIWHIPDSFMLPLVVFWGVVCMAYLFTAIEKMIHYVVKAPDAVLEKLEFGVFEESNLENQEEYEAFRGQLASINDIAATIVARSTGRDLVIMNCLETFRNIHNTYIGKAMRESNLEARKACFRACRAVQQEILRIYREAVSSKNEHACSTILKTYYAMVRDAVNAGADYLYITEQIQQIERFQSYVLPTMIEIIEEQATTDWYFNMMPYFKDVKENTEYLRVCIAQQLTSTLTTITTRDDYNLMNKFMRIASNGDIDIGLDGISYEWLAILDHALVMYLEWLYTALPDNADKYARLFAAYSLPHNLRMRSVLCNSVARLRLLIDEDRNMRDILSGRRVSKAQIAAERLAEKRAEMTDEEFAGYSYEAPDIVSSEQYNNAAIPDNSTAIAKNEPSDKDVLGSKGDVRKIMTAGFDIKNPKISGRSETLIGINQSMCDEKIMAYMTVFSYITRPGNSEFLNRDEITSELPETEFVFNGFDKILESSEDSSAYSGDSRDLLEKKLGIMRLASSDFAEIK